MRDPCGDIDHVVVVDLVHLVLTNRLDTYGALIYNNLVMVRMGMSLVFLPR
jgi:hypothetical protein